MLKRSLSFLIIAALLLSTVSMVAFADTVINVEGADASGNYYYCIDGKKNPGFTGGDLRDNCGWAWNGSFATEAYSLTAGVKYTIIGKFGGDGDTSAVRLDVDGTSQGSQTIGRKSSREDFVELSWTYTPERSGNAKIEFVKEGNNIYFDYMRVEQVGEAAPVVPAVTSVTAGGVTVTDGGKIPYTTTSLVIAFNTAIAPASVTKENITLTGVKYEVEAVDGTAVVTFAGGLDTLKNYTLTVSGIKNENNDVMSDSYNLSFSTTGINKLVAELQGEDATSWTYTAGEYGYDVRENCVTLNGGDTYITSKAVSVTEGTQYAIEVSAAKNSGYQNGATTSFKVTVSDGTEFTVTLPSEYDVFSTYTFDYTPAATGDVTFTVQRSDGYCNYDIDYVMVSEFGTAKLIALSAQKSGDKVTAVVKGADVGDDVYLALYAADETLAKCYKRNYTGEDVVFTPEGDYATATVFLWKDGTAMPLCPAAPVK